jgi:hypothetical protein
LAIPLRQLYYIHSVLINSSINSFQPLNINDENKKTRID